EEVPRALDQAALGSMASVGLPEELVWPASAAVPKLAIVTESAKTAVDASSAMAARRAIFPRVRFTAISFLSRPESLVQSELQVREEDAADLCASCIGRNRRSRMLPFSHCAQNIT